MEYYRQLNGRDVWVTVHKPLVYNEQGNQYVESPKYCSAFKFDKAPGVVIGEYLREGNDLKWFTTATDAANKAFQEAIQRLK